MELLKGFDDLLDLKSFIGLESDFALSTAVIGSEAHQTWTEMAIKDYQTRSFVNEAGRKDKTPNSLYLFELLGGKSSKYFDRVFPATFFSSISFTTGAVNITSETVAVHHFSGTWKNRRSKIKDLIMRRIAKLLGESTFERVKNMENQLVLKSNIFLTNFVSILMTLQLGLGFLSLTSLITVSAGAFLQLVVFYCCMYFQYFLMKKYRIGT